MGFPHQDLKPFDRPTIETLHESQIGVYGLLRSGQMVYIGRGNLRARLLSHLRGDNTCISRNRPSHWVAVAATQADSERLEAQFIREYQPVCNRRVG